MAYTNPAKHAMLDHLGALITHISIHSANPGTTGASEVTGGGYVRQEPTFNSASSGEITLSAPLDFDGPLNSPALFFGVWVVNVFYGGGTISGDTEFDAEGQFRLQSGTRLDLNA